MGWRVECSPGPGYRTPKGSIPVSVRARIARRAEIFMRDLYMCFHGDIDRPSEKIDVDGSLVKLGSMTTSV